ncbi:MAG: flagellar hook-basal body complex protein FliE [Planctomycetes bacterium]|nr:flagellar hook-basal body complex protein FliE [Planctomycetota bacterium]
MEQRSIGDGHALSRPVKPVGGPSQPHLLKDLGTEAPGADKSFRQILGETIQEVNARQTEADQAIEALVTGETDNMAEVMTAVEKADLAFRTLMQMRNKLVQAYEEISRLRI